MVLDDGDPLVLDKRDAEFFRTFALDVRAFLGPIVQELWQARRAIGAMPAQH